MWEYETDSAMMGLGGSKEDCREIGAGESRLISSSAAGVDPGVGEVNSNCVKKGAL
jgi:hypothetical protein